MQHYQRLVKVFKKDDDKVSMTFIKDYHCILQGRKLVYNGPQVNSLGVVQFYLFTIDISDKCTTFSVGDLKDETIINKYDEVIKKFK